MTMKNTLVRIALFVFVLGAYSACGNDATSTSGGEKKKNDSSVTERGSSGAARGSSGDATSTSGGEKKKNDSSVTERGSSGAARGSSGDATSTSGGEKKKNDSSLTERGSSGDARGSSGDATSTSGGEKKKNDSSVTERGSSGDAGGSGGDAGGSGGDARGSGGDARGSSGDARGSDETADPVLVARETKAECDNAAYTAINDEAGLMAINTSPDTLAGDYCLVASITLTATNWKPIGTAAAPFMGNFDGNGHTITGLKINTPTKDNVGLFGDVGQITNAATTAGVIQNLTIKDAHVTGKDKVGILVGRVYAEAIRRVAIEGGDVTGNTRVGGLVGENTTSTIENSYSTATATATTLAEVGALVGIFGAGKVKNSYAVNTFIGDVGADAAIENSYCYGCTLGQGQKGLNVISAANTEKRADADGVDKYYDTASTPEKEIFVDWDFENIWRWNEGRKMPTLR